jgi:hypothetical protein
MVEEVEEVEEVVCELSEVLVEGGIESRHSTRDFLVDFRPTGISRSFAPGLHHTSLALGRHSGLHVRIGSFEIWLPLRFPVLGFGQGDM